MQGYYYSKLKTKRRKGSVYLWTRQEKNY